MKFNSMLVACGLSAVCSVALAEDKPAHWTYQGHGGPAHWSELDEGFSGCKLGKQQSPIDIRGARQAKLAPIDFAYAPGGASVVNNGHTVQVNLAEGGAIRLADGDYKLLQFHFHTPSEEKVNGVSYPLVAHFVHKSEAGKLAVVAVLFQKGASNPALRGVFDALPAKANESRELDEGINPEAVLPARRGYYAYVGSLTTPPCSEGVLWHVLKQPVSLSAAQLKSFQKLYPMNARPVQALNGRTVEASE
ncbi:carbonic anhydrase [Janthinobacterium fluminis]|uniref:carbonic anhydrase n=1 Tax=Janthinobacterium fluminis TaxID=2987524 RepID=A0ABT5K4Y4_9BURK|nr:carbonic anhydrase family protein [Janthinobacterium fluminis]MDC8759520.1 carbonic anhydrase family protein [Janthinobacterium fluminis]